MRSLWGRQGAPTPRPAPSQAEGRGTSGAALALAALALLLGAGRPAPKAQDAEPASLRPERPRRRRRDAAQLAARRAALQPADYIALWRLVHNEAPPGASDAVCTEMCWAAIQRAHLEGMTVARLLMPAGLPARPRAGRPPWETWRPLDAAGRPAPAPATAARTAAAWVQKDPQLQGAVDWMEPARMDAQAARGAQLRQAREDGRRLTPQEVLDARYYEDADAYRAQRCSLGRVGPSEFFSASGG